MKDIKGIAKIIDDTDIIKENKNDINVTFIKKNRLRENLNEPVINVHAAQIRNKFADLGISIPSKASKKEKKQPMSRANLGLEATPQHASGPKRSKKHGYIPGKFTTLNSDKKFSHKGRSLKKILSSETLGVIENRIENDEDIEMKTIISTKRSLKKGRKTAKTVKRGVKKTILQTKKVTEKTIQTGQYFYKIAQKAILSPVVWKGAGIASLVLVVIAIILAIASFFMSAVSVVTLKTDDIELTKTYEYITKLDAELTYEIRNIKNRIENIKADYFNYYINGLMVTDPIKIDTNADLLIAYLDVANDDYIFDNIRDHIDDIHKALYSYNVSERIEFINPSEGEIERKKHLDISINIKSLARHIEEAELLNSEGRERLKVLQEIGIYTAKQTLSSPFEDYTISSRWGWRVHPISNNLSMHKGIDIPKPEGTNIKSIMPGKVKFAGYNNSYGYYVIVENKNSKGKVLYAHMKKIHVYEGQLVTYGTKIGEVGTTGNSTGFHLHLEYYIDNINTNPIFFLENAN